MNRRDTILVAVFVNTGVLGLLFLMGVNKEELTDGSNETQRIVQAMAPSNVEIAAAAPVFVVKPYDEPPEIEEDNDFDFDNDGLVQKQQEEESPSLPNGYFEVKVKRGDFLERIARANGTTVEEIKKINRLSSEKLNIGQILRIPSNTQNKFEPIVTQNKAPAPIAISAPPPVKNDAESVYYTVKSGDNPWKIAKQFNIRVDQLLKLNNLNETKAKNLKVGDKLRVK